MKAENLRRTSEKNPNWRGDDAKYATRHQRVWHARGPASAHGCYNRALGLRACTSDRYEWSLLHDDGPYDPLSYRL